ncbi:MAG: hypothetical protein E6Q40_13275 [Cupriavidus sp.]|nr:MAG: hypothetical protein E6Q40_13275 [Cupriavidus sp.]
MAAAARGNRIRLTITGSARTNALAGHHGGLRVHRHRTTTSRAGSLFDTYAKHRPTSAPARAASDGDGGDGGDGGGGGDGGLIAAVRCGHP